MINLNRSVPESRRLQRISASANGEQWLLILKTKIDQANSPNRPTEFLVPSTEGSKYKPYCSVSGVLACSRSPVVVG